MRRRSCTTELTCGNSNAAEAAEFVYDGPQARRSSCARSSHHAAELACGGVFPTEIAMNADSTDKTILEGATYKLLVRPSNLP